MQISELTDEREQYWLASRIQMHTRAQRRDKVLYLYVPVDWWAVREEDDNDHPDNGGYDARINEQLHNLIPIERSPEDVQELLHTYGDGAKHGIDGLFARYLNYDMFHHCDTSDANIKYYCRCWVGQRCPTHLACACMHKLG